MNTLAFKIGWRLLLYPALLLGTVAFVFFWNYAHPRRLAGALRPEHYKLRSESLKLQTADGLQLDAWFIPNAASKRAVIVCHGYPADKSDVLGLTDFLAKDFNLLYFDFRATGRSGGFFATGGAREVRDIDAAVQFLAGRGFSTAGIFGFSMGGSAALLSTNPAIKARALDSAYAELSGELEHIFSGLRAWRRPLLAGMNGWSLLLLGVNLNSVSPVGNAAALRQPLLLVHGDADEQVPHANSLAIKAAAPAAELWLVKGAGHGETRERAGAEYERRVAAFFRKNL